jgi:hypothetical protein
MKLLYLRICEDILRNDKSYDFRNLHRICFSKIKIIILIGTFFLQHLLHVKVHLL